MNQKILFGTAGVPHSAIERDSIAGIHKIRKLGLDAMELEFVYGVHMKKDAAEQTHKAAAEENVSLSVHAPYYINLNSEEKEKIAASKQRIFESARIGSIAGAKKTVFHAGFFGKTNAKEAFENIAIAIEEIAERMNGEKTNAVLAPELTGKPAQFGSLQELLQLTERIKGIELTVDFSHLHARTNGSLKTKNDFEKVLQEIKDFDAGLLGHLHMHVSGIKYSEKGERNHLNLLDKANNFDYKLLLETLKEFVVAGTIVCESPNLENDAILMKKYWEKL